MDINRSIYYGFDGQRDAIPRIPTSARKWENCSSEEESPKVSAFDLLATLAGTLLHEGKSCSASSSAVSVNNKHIFQENFEKEHTDIATQQIHRNLCGSNIDTPYSSHNKAKHVYKRIKFVHGKGAVSECISTVNSSSTEDKIRSSTNPSRNVSEGTVHNTMMTGSIDFEDALDYSIQNTVEIQLCSNREEDGDLTTMADTSDSLPKELILDREIDIPICPQNNIPNSTFPTNDDDLYIGNKVECVENPQNRLHGVKSKPFKQSTHVIGRRVKRLFKSKSWRLSSRTTKRDISRVAGCATGSLRIKMKTHKHRRRYRMGVVLGDKKLCDPTCEDGSSRESFVCFPENESNINSGSGDRDMAVGRQASLPSNSSHVKINIKSFRVPELSIEVPNTGTIGYLKRVVMAAVLGREYHIGVILDGEEIGDDHRTLVDTGIPHLDRLGFSLKPCSSQPFTSPPPSVADPPTLRHCSDHRHYSRSYINTSMYSLQQPTAVSGVGYSEVRPEESPTDTFGNYSESNTRVSSPTEVLTHSSVSDSRALITVPSLNAHDLSLVPMNHQIRRSDRRTRRPFSVYEVEALVQAVEQIGTGRWRDVKLSAFENASHRTYVDLKDKWKTLVHTASISPHQRRGEPVPQQLLDRVLQAHASWSTQQHGVKQEVIADLGFAYHHGLVE